jgi:broad specificity phosphatase PhoE
VREVHVQQFAVCCQLTLLHLGQALDEIDAGICDGMTYKQIAQDHPSEYEARKADKLKYR